MLVLRVSFFLLHVIILALVEHVLEFIKKQLVGKNAEHGGDAAQAGDVGGGGGAAGLPGVVGEAEEQRPALADGAGRQPDRKSVV